MPSDQTTAHDATERDMRQVFAWSAAFVVLGLAALAGLLAILRDGACHV